MTKQENPADTNIEYPKAGGSMNDIKNNKQIFNNASALRQGENEHNEKSVSTVSSFHTMMIGDTTVRLSFSDNGDLSTQLANAFQTMLN